MHITGIPRSVFNFRLSPFLTHKITFEEVLMVLCMSVERIVPGGEGGGAGSCGLGDNMVECGGGGWRFY